MVAGSSGECVSADESKITLKVNGNSIISSFSLGIQRLQSSVNQKLILSACRLTSCQSLFNLWMDLTVCVCLCLGGDKYSVQLAAIVATDFNFLCRIVTLKGFFFFFFLQARKLWGIFFPSYNYSLHLIYLITLIKFVLCDTCLQYTVMLLC